MNRIQKRFETLRAKNEKALVAFITAGDPDLQATPGLFAEIEKNGADIIELGVPFSDPLADGPVIQNASQRALKSGTTLKKIIATVAGIRRTSELPIVLMTSFNPVFVYGEERFAVDAVNAGVDGVIIPDLPPEEAGEFSAMAEKQGLFMIHLCAPTSDAGRMRMIAEQSRGFIYYISLTGTTGTRLSMTDSLREKAAALKKCTPLPVLIGFGISGSEQARSAAEVSDGVIVGSAIVNIIAEDGPLQARQEKVGQFIAGIKEALTRPA